MKILKYIRNKIAEIKRELAYKKTKRAQKERSFQL